MVTPAVHSYCHLLSLPRPASCLALAQKQLTKHRAVRAK